MHASATRDHGQPHTTDTRQLEQLSGEYSWGSEGGGDFFARSRDGQLNKQLLHDGVDYD